VVGGTNEGVWMGANWSQPIDSGVVPNNDSNFDVIVVGGGPSGSSAASFAAMAGHRVLLLEKSVYPRDKTCGDAVGGSAMRIVTELGVRPLIEKTPLFRVDSIIFSGPGKNTTVRIALPQEQVEDRTAGYSLPRL
jgi:flavin-dependent dehydrogenase